MTPPIAVPWPPRYLVAECTTMSAPCSNGRMRYGRGHGVVDDQRHAGRVRDGRHRLEVEDVELRVGDRLGVEAALVFGLTAARQESGSSGFSTKPTVMP